MRAEKNEIFLKKCLHDYLSYGILPERVYNCAYQGGPLPVGFYPGKNVYLRKV